MPMPKKQWTHRFSNSQGAIPTSATIGGFRDLENWDGTSNVLRKLKEIKVLLSLAMEVPTTGGTDEVSMVVGWHYREKSLGATEVSFEDPQIFWRPVPFSFVGPQSTSNSTIAARHMFRWRAINVPENYTFRMVMIPWHMDANMHWAIQSHWMEQRENM